MPNPKRPWYKRFPQDFAMGVRGMPLDEIGAYTLLIDAMHDRGESLPDDPQFLSALLGVATKSATSIVDKLVRRGKVYRRADRIGNARVDRDLEAAKRYSDAQRERVEARWAKRKKASKIKAGLDTSVSPKINGDARNGKASKINGRADTSVSPDPGSWPGSCLGHDPKNRPDSPVILSEKPNDFNEGRDTIQSIEEEKKTLTPSETTGSTSQTEPSVGHALRDQDALPFELEAQTPSRTVDGDFAEFWERWPPGRKPKKPIALVAYRKARKIATHEAIMAGLERSIRLWEREGNLAPDRRRYIPHPSSWLNAQQWTDEIELPPDPPPPPGQDQTLTQYQHRLNVFRTQGLWLDGWGPRPILEDPSPSSVPAQSTGKLKREETTR
jgi:uncharacterized protein YdaU (DUF1376 family)